MALFYLIRHGESEANRKRILASRLPFPLSPEGKADARLIAGELKELTSLDRIISSPLLRARETAEPFSGLFNLPVETDERLSEQDLGIYSGMNYDEVKTERDYEKNPLNRWDWQPAGGGESYAMVSRRVKSFFLDMEKVPKERILVVTHAVVFRLIRGFLEQTLPLYPESFPNNGEIWKVDFTGIGDYHNIESLFLGNSRDFVHNP